MGNAFGSSDNSTKKRQRSKAFETCDGDDDPLGDLPHDVGLIVLGGELSAKQREAAGHYFWELENAGRDHASNPVLARDDVVAIEPPSTLEYKEPELNVIHAAAFCEWAGCPPDNATIRTMGAVERRALKRFWSKEWSICGKKSYDGAAKSLQAGESFKATAIAMNGGEEPDEAFFLKHLTVRNRDYARMRPAKVLWYSQLHRCYCKQTPVWVESNKEWLEEHGVFSAWEKHRASAYFVLQGGFSAESRGGDSAIQSALNRRLQCKEFVYPDDDKWYRVLCVRWIREWKTHAVLCYEARLADPHANQKCSYYINRMEPESFSASVEEVDDWIERSPKRPRT